MSRGWKRMKFTQAFKMAASSILANKMRSFLTMLGIIIGIMSVITLVGIGEGSKKTVQDSIQSMGTNLLTVSITGGRDVNITTDELNNLKTDPGIKDIAPTVTGNVTAKIGDKNTSVSLQASVPDFANIRNMSVQSGRFINQNDVDNRYRVAVLGTEVLDTLAPRTPYSDFLNKTITINGMDFTVVGILQSQGSTMTGSGDNTIIMPISTAQRLLKNKSIKTFYVEAQSSDMVDTAMTYLNQFMTVKTKGIQNSFRVFNQSQMLDTQNKAADSMTVMLAGIAAISLFVGGIGIMNIMLVSVTERTREIGIRKAIGAKRRDILVQFLIESIVLSGLGGIVGVLGGVLAANVYSKMAGQAVVISPNVSLLSFGFAVTVGVIFGLYPANKASKLRPIEALRYE